jgi:hypothetical protein
VFFLVNCTNQLKHLNLGIIHVFKWDDRKQVIQEPVAMIGCGLLQDASCMKLDVLCAMNLKSETRKQITLSTIKNCVAKSGFPVDPMYSDNDNALRLTEDE